MVNWIIKKTSILIDGVCRAFGKYVKNRYYTSRLGYCGKNVVIKKPEYVSDYSLLELHDNTCLYEGFLFISKGGKLIMKDGSGAAQRLTVITGNHGRSVGIPFKQEDGNVQFSLNKEENIIIEEDVWIGSDVVLCSGVTIGRCANIGAGTVVRHKIPPYAIVIGNPAKIIGFCFTPEEAFEHEKAIYPEEIRLPFEELEKNYRRYFLNRLNEIKQINKL